MVAYFDIAGKKVGAHVLSMLTLGTTFGGAYLASRGGSSKEAKKLPPIQASSGDEEAFIKEFLAAAEKETAKQ